MAFDDLRTFLDQPTLVLPIGKKKYTVQPCKADVWLRLQEIASKEEPVPDMDLFRLALGPDVLDAMLPNVTGPELRRAGITAYMWQLGQENVAERFWRDGSGKAQTSEETPTQTRPGTRTGGANTTRRQGSGSGTSTRRKSNAAAKD